MARVEGILEEVEYFGKMKKKIFIQDFESEAKKRKNFIEGTNKNKNLELVIDITEIGNPTQYELPRGYDGYVVHYSTINDISVLKELRDEQPECFIWLFTGNPEFFSDCSSGPLKGLIDRTYETTGIIYGSESKQILEDISGFKQ